MKIILVSLIIATVVLACGCTAPGPREPSGGIPGTMTMPEPGAPDLVGTWTGTMNGYDKGIGFNPHPGGMMVLTVTEQHGRVVAGKLTITENNVTSASEDFAGTIGRDGRTITIVEEAGYCSGEITGPDEMELVYALDGPGFAISIDSLRRA